METYDDKTKFKKQQYPQGYAQPSEPDFEKFKKKSIPRVEEPQQAAGAELQKKSIPGAGEPNTAITAQGTVENYAAPINETVTAPQITPAPVQGGVPNQQGAESNPNDVAQVQEMYSDGQSSQQNMAPVAENPVQNWSGTPDAENGVQQNNNFPTDNQAVSNTQNANGAQTSNGEAQPLFMSDPALRKEYETEVNSWGLNGNVDMYARPMVSSEKMQKAGYSDVPNGSTATIYTQTYSFGKRRGKGANGEDLYEHSVIITPISGAGKVYSPKALGDYLDWLLRESKGDPAKMIALDKEKAGLLVGIDAPEGTEEKIHKAHEKYYLGGQKEADAQGVNNNTGDENGKNTTSDANTANADTTPTTDGTSTPNNATSATNVGTNNTDVDAQNTNNVNTSDTQNTNGVQSAVKGENNANVANANGANNADNSVNNANAANASSAPSATANTVPSVQDYARLRPSTLRVMAEIETDPEKKKNIEAAIAAKKEAPSATTESKAPELTDEEKKDKEASTAVLKDKYGKAHFKIDGRRKATEADMREQGWNAVGDQTVYPIIEKIKDKDGKVHKVLMTPIYADGSVLSQDDYKAFVETLDGFDDADDLLDRDTHGIIIKLDADDGDVDEIDDLTKKALKGELVKDMYAEADEEYDPDKSAARRNMVESKERIERKIAEINEQLKDPEKSLRSVALEEKQKALDDIDEGIKKIEKRKKTAGIIAGIGDILQGFANLAGTIYGANSMQLSSLSAASRSAYERELTKQEKRREEIVKNLAKIKDDLRKNKDTELSEWVKQLKDINKEILKFDADAEKAFRNARLKRKEKSEESKAQNQRRAVETQEKRKIEKYKHDLRKDEIALKGAIQSGLIAQRANAKAASGKKKKGGRRRGGSRPASRR